MSNDYERRFLAQHNRNRTPNRADGGRPSLQTTPVKAGDRFIPSRRDSNEWPTRFAARLVDRPHATPTAGGDAEAARSASRLHRSHSSMSVFSAASYGQHFCADQSQYSASRIGVSAHRALLRNELLNGEIDHINTAITSSMAATVGATPPPSTRRVSSAFAGTMCGVTAQSAGAAASRQTAAESRLAPAPAAASALTSPALFQFNHCTRSSDRTPTKTPRGGDRSRSPVSSENRGGGGGSASHPPGGSRRARACSSLPARGQLRRAADAGSAVRNLSAIYSLSPLGDDSRRLLQSPRAPPRKIPHQPYKTLDAPNLADDFYYDVLHWSALDSVAVGLGDTVYLWSAITTQTRPLFTTNASTPVTSVQFDASGCTLAAGTGTGTVQLWDVHTERHLATLRAHIDGTKHRVGKLAWSGTTLCSGGQDATVCQMDVRLPPAEMVYRYKLHQQEVCGLAFSPCGEQLASGSNDNTVAIWSRRADEPLHTFDDHRAAVKAVAWSPHQRGILATGGGTNDRTICIRNTTTMQLVQAVDAKTQVCSIVWSPHTGELAAAHGFSQNHISVWRYPQMEQMAELNGHTQRVLYLALSPDGQSVVSGAADETLRFWKIFPGPQRRKHVQRSLLNFYDSLR